MKVAHYGRQQLQYGGPVYERERPSSGAYPRRAAGPVSHRGPSRVVLGDYLFALGLLVIGLVVGGVGAGAVCWAWWG